MAVAHRPLDGLDEVRRGLESERDWIADIQISDAPCRGFDRLRFGHDVADGVGESVNPLRDRNRTLTSLRIGIFSSILIRHS